MLRADYRNPRRDAERLLHVLRSTASEPWYSPCYGSDGGTASRRACSRQTPPIAPQWTVQFGGCPKIGKFFSAGVLQESKKRLDSCLWNGDPLRALWYEVSWESGPQCS